MTRPPHPKWKDIAPQPSGETFAHQGKLPSLPVLPLAPTLGKLKDSLRPLAWNAAEYEATVRKIDEFAAPGGLGQTLQTRLEEWAAPRRHWLEEWWDDLAYLTYRDSVVVNVSYYYGFDEHPAHLLQTASHRAASITRAALLFRQKLKQGLVKPDATKEGPICMDTWRWMFDCCRIPGERGADWSHTYAVPGDDGGQGHIIVFRRNSMWKVEIARNGQLLSVSEFEHIFDHIKKKSAEREWVPMGFLAANDRDTWAKDYVKLISNQKNQSYVRDIHSSAFAVCLDETSPEGPVEYSRALWHGGPSGNGLSNRWVDKPVQFVVYDNMKAGIMGEHSVMDGTPTARMCDEILDAVMSPDFDTGDKPGSVFLTRPENADSNLRRELTSLVAASVENIRWVVDEDLEKRLSSARTKAAELCDSQTLGYYLTRYGKQQIKDFGFSPDGWAQMIVQLAYSRLLRKYPHLQGAQPAAANEPVHLPGGTYEAASTRKYFKGRTEAIRVTSLDSRAWVAAMEDTTSTPEKRRELFAVALKRHGADARAAGNGQGIDRHILGLKQCLKQGEKVELFQDALFQRGSNWVLSTSAIFSKHFPVYGWGEVVPNGFGVAYMTGYDDRLQYTITSRVEMPNADFVDEIARAAEDLRELFATASIPDASKSRL